MSARQGYIGGYLNPELKERFVEQAEEQGMSQTDYLHEILTSHLTGDNDPAQEQEADDIQEEYLWDRMDTNLQEYLNSLIVQATEEVTGEHKNEKAFLLETLADLLNEAAEVEMPVEIHEAVAFEEVLDEDLADEITDLIAKSIEEDGGQPLDHNSFFILAANNLYIRADELFKGHHQIQLSFSREEWYYLDKLLVEANSGSRRKFGNLTSYIRYKLGEQLDYIGRDFLFMFPTDEEMVNTGQKMMSEATDSATDR